MHILSYTIANTSDLLTGFANSTQPERWYWVPRNLQFVSSNLSYPYLNLNIVVRYSLSPLYQEKCAKDSWYYRV